MNKRDAIKAFWPALERLHGEALDSENFVRMVQLAKLFDVELKLQPLLAEAMLITASASKGSGEQIPLRNYLLLDSDFYGYSMSDLFSESFGKPLTGRFRFSVAHELTHLMSLRHEDIGLEFLRRNKGGAVSKSETLEAETNLLAPLLLFGERAIFFQLGDDPLSLSHLMAIRRNHGVSREILVKRFRLFQLRRDYLSRDPILDRLALTNCAFGYAEWQSNSASLRSFATFSNFENAIEPIGLLKARFSKSEFDISNWISESEQVSGRYFFESKAGISFDYLPFLFRCELEIEQTSRSDGQRFIWFLRKI